MPILELVVGFFLFVAMFGIPGLFLFAAICAAYYLIQLLFAEKKNPPD